MFKDYLLQNWALILILLAFEISLMTTVFLDKKSIQRYNVLIAVIFLLSISVFVEFYLAKVGVYQNIRIVLMAVRYSATPLIIAQIMFTLIKKTPWTVFVPAIVLAVIDVISIFTGIVFGLDKSNKLVRGPLGPLPFIVAGFYCVFLIYTLLKRSNKRMMEIVPIAFLSITLASGVVLPFVFGSDFSAIFVTTIAVALFAYYEFSALLLTKKDSLTGLLNRQAYYADIDKDSKSITALLSIDMNGLKTINDNYGHAAGDEAIMTLALCFIKSLKSRQFGYRVGGDEFVVVCKKTDEKEVLALIERIKKCVGETKYKCSIGYSVAAEGIKNVDDMLKEADRMMYADKARYYAESGIERRKS